MHYFSERWWVFFFFFFFIYIILEGDALQIVKEVNSNSSSMHSSGHFIEGIKEELDTFRSYLVIHVRKEANFAAHTLAKDAATTGNDLSWLEDIPISICDIVIRKQVVRRS